MFDKFNHDNANLYNDGSKKFTKRPWTKYLKKQRQLHPVHKVVRKPTSQLGQLIMMLHNHHHNN